jgi:hypothetical protein
MTDDDADLRALLGSLDPKTRDDLRRVLIRDQAAADPSSSKSRPRPSLEGTSQVPSHPTNQTITSPHTNTASKMAVPNTIGHQGKIDTR